MKHIRYISSPTHSARIAIICLLLSILSITIQAQTFNAFVIDINGGYAGVKEGVGATAGMRLGYGMRYKHFIFRLGTGMAYDYNNTPMPDNSEILPAIDSEQIEYLRHNNYTKRVDITHKTEIQAHLLMGGEWDYFYFMLGCTPAWTIYGATTINAQIQVYGDYDMFYDPFMNMPNHGYTTKPYQSDPLPIPTSMALYASAEIGAPVGEYFQIGAFADYPVYAPTPQNYRVGVRLTAWFGRLKKKHEPCRCILDNYLPYQY